MTCNKVAIIKGAVVFLTVSNRGLPANTVRIKLKKLTVGGFAYYYVYQQQILNIR